MEKKFYPYREAVSIFDEWFKAHPEERALRDRLTISGLSSAVKAEKRCKLAQMLAGVVDVHVETELRIGGTEKKASLGAHLDMTSTVDHDML